MFIRQSKKQYVPRRMCLVRALRILGTVMKGKSGLPLLLALRGPESGIADRLLVSLRQQGISNRLIRKEGVWRGWEGRGK